MNRLPSATLACLLALAAVQAASAGEILLRFASFGTDDPLASIDLSGVMIAAEDERSLAFDIPGNGFSPAIAAPEASRALQLIQDGDAGAVLAHIRLPNEGRRFLVIVIAHGDDSIHPHVIRANDPEFRSGDVMIMNLTGLSFEADLGQRRLGFEPGSRTIFRPERIDERANYQVRFFHLQSGAPELFAATLWPYFNDKRAFVFLHIDPRTRSPSIRSIDESTGWIDQ